MKTLEWTTVDKSTWTPGPWQSEPDKKQWQDPKTGLPCLIVRGPAGSLCGYVGVSVGHPAFEQDYDDVSVDVHGGLTFANRCQPKVTVGHGICHTVDEGEDDKVWWLGFDCAHSGDLIPKLSYPTRSQTLETYRTLKYVENECRSLAEQLHRCSVSPTKG